MNRGQRSLGGSPGRSEVRLAPLAMASARRPNPVFSDEYAAVRQVLVTARMGAGVSQRGLAARLGKAQSHVCRIEQGERRVDLLEFYLIAKALGVNPTGLFSDIVRSLDAAPAAAPSLQQARTRALA
jgi:ribosome-binding protein aMBF1 (putative translation factor)